MATEKGAYFEIDTVSLATALHQVVTGPKTNQQVVVPGRGNDFGVIAANDWTVFDGMGSGPNLVGNAQGIHTGGSMTDVSWNIYFDLVFKAGRFMGSTLKLLGNFGPGDGEWAIVGGTGEFTLAQGVVAFRKVQGNGTDIRELKFRVFYTPLKA